MDDFVTLAYDYPVLGAFWTAMWVFLWVLWIFLLFRIIFDIFRDDNLNGWAKTAWLLLVVVIPFIGVFAYVVIRGTGMGRREEEHARSQQRAVDAYIQDTAGRGRPLSEAEEISKLAELKARGAITDGEFQKAKEKILS